MNNRENKSQSSRVLCFQAGPPLELSLACYDRDGLRFDATQRQMIISDANLNGIAERRSSDYAHGSAGQYAHLHQAASDCAGACDRYDPRRFSARHGIERDSVLL